MKRIILLFIFIQFTGISFLQAQPLKLWTKYYKPPVYGHEYRDFQALVLSSGELIYAETEAAMSTVSIQSTKLYVSKRSGINGVTLKRVCLSSPLVSPDSAMSDHVECISKDSANNIYIVANCYSSMYHTNRPVLIKLDRTLTEQWRSFYPDGTGYFSRDVVCKNNKIYWLGEICGGGYFLRVYSNSGTNLLSITTTAGNNPEKLLVTDSGDFYIVGMNYPYTTVSAQVELDKYNDAGILQWTKTYNGTKNLCSESVVDAILNQSGDICILGDRYVGYAHSDDVYILKIDSAGILQYSKLINGTANASDHAGQLAVDLNNNLYVTCSLYNFAGTNGYNSDITIKKIANDGTVRRTIKLITSGYADDWPTGLGVGTNGFIYLTGLTHFPGNDKGIFAAFDSSLVLQYKNIITSVSPDSTNNDGVYSKGLILDSLNRKAYWLGLLFQQDTSNYQNDVSKLMTVCYSMPSTLRIALPEIPEQNSSLTANPNPANSFLTIASLSKISSLDIYTEQGQCIYSTLDDVMEQTKFNLNIEKFDIGFYIVRAHLIDGSISSTKFIKQ